MPDRDHRDRAVERLLPQVLGGAPSAECVDGETLAAWTDGRLRQSDTARVERHVADCARCQALLGAFVRISPPAVVTETLWQRWRLGWLLPLATAAAAVALWAIIPETRMRPESQVSFAEPQRDTPAAAAPPTARTEPAAPALPAGPQRETAPLSAPPPSEADRSTQRRRDADDSRRRSVDALAKLEAPETRSKPLADEERAQEKEKVTTLAEAAAQAPPPPAAAPAPAAPPAPPATPAAADTRIGGARAAEQKSASNAAFARPAPEAEPAAATPVFRAGVTLVEVPTPVASIRWRLIDGRELQRTTTGGARWDAVTLPDNSGQLTAGSAPSTDVCWIVGRAGRIYLATDGRRFTRLAFPEPLDLVSVRATDARTATVTTTDGRSFQTTDAGATWR